MADPFRDNLTTLARRIKPLILNSLRSAPGIAAVMLNRIILIPPDGTDPIVFPKSSIGLAAALAAAESFPGSEVWIPPCQLVGTQSIPADVSLIGFSRYLTSIDGTINLESGSKLENVSISLSAGSPCINGPGSGIAVISGSNIQSLNIGDAIGILGDAGEMEIWDCKISGISSGGDGYGILCGSGSVYMDGGWLSGSTAPVFDGELGDPIVPSYSVGTSFGHSPLENAYIRNLDIGGDPPVDWLDPDWDPAGDGWQTPEVYFDGDYSACEGIADSYWIKDPTVTDLGASWGDITGYHHKFSLDCDHVFGATLEYWANDILLEVYINGVPLGINYNFWHADNHCTDHASQEIDTTPFLPNADNIISILVENTPHAEFGSDTGLNYKLTVYTSGMNTLITNGVRMDPVGGEPSQGDRSAWNAEEYQARHANDIDTASGIHHTLGVGATQAAAGDHSHGESGFDPDTILVDGDGSILIDADGNVIIGG